MMKKPQTLGAVHTHTHTDSFLENIKIEFCGEFFLSQILIEGFNRLGLALCYIVM